MNEENASLRYTGGNSDKLYFLHLIQQGSGWVVNFEYGRYGSTLQSGTKTKAGPVDYAAAKKIYDKIYREKTGEGYKPFGEKSAVIASAPVDVAEWLPQLLNPIDEVQAAALLNDPNWGMQEKFDGVNRIVGTTEKGEPFAVNKLGKPVPVSATLADDLTDAHQRYGRIVVAGEGMGEMIRAHDLLWLGYDLRPSRFDDRYHQLQNLLENWLFAKIIIAPLFTSNQDKIREYTRLLKGNFEGVVFKRLNSTYTPGRPASGGDQLKFKFWAEPAAVIVCRINDKSSIGMEMLNENDERVFVGNCTIPVNHEMPQVGAIVEIKYLYINTPGGHLYQPIYLGPKDAGQLSDCYTKQLKIKA